MAKILAEILSEEFDTGGPDSKKKKFYIRKIGRKHFGKFFWNSGRKSFVRKGGLYSTRNDAIRAAKISV